MPHRILARTKGATATAEAGTLTTEPRAATDPAPPVRPSVPAASLPDGTRLLHIGPHKTGTTAIQAALWAAREQLLPHGVRLVGRSRNPSGAVRAVVGQKSPYGDTPPAIGNWNALVGEFQRAREPRVVVSSEFFAWAKPDSIRRIVDALDPERVRIAVTLRPILRVIPSMWQQNVQQGTVTPFETWVEGLLAPPGSANQAFWTLERHDALIQRWAEVVGVERVTAVVVDDRHHEVLPHAFETLLGLPPGTLRAVQDLTNRSLTRPEAEAVRAFNIAFKAEGLPRDLHARTMRFGAAQVMKRSRTPGSGEPSVRVPERFVASVEAIQREVVANVLASGVAILGDPDSLLAPPSPAGPDSTAGSARKRRTVASDAPDGQGSISVPPEVAGALAMGLLESTGAIRMASISKGPFRFAEPVEVSRVPTYQLSGALASRIWRATVGRLLVRSPRVVPEMDADDDVV